MLNLFLIIFAAILCALCVAVSILYYLAKWIDGEPISNPYQQERFKK